MTSEEPLHIGKPSWLKTSIPTGKTFFDVRNDLRERKLVTVCEEAKCPNIGECWNTRTATFMILGEVCTRGCRFCNVKTGDPKGFIDEQEPQQVALSAKKMGLRYTVITMVDRDDLPDFGAQHVAQVVNTVASENPGIIVELLAGDFRGDHHLLDLVLSSQIGVYAHNIETVERLTPRVRDARATYRKSLSTLLYAKHSPLTKHRRFFTKSALMLGLGETEDEVIAALRDLRAHQVDFLTIGQYMRPTKKHLAIKEWVHPEQFARLEQIAYELGFMKVASSPLVRSSYRAREFYESAVSVNQGASGQL